MPLLAEELVPAEHQDSLVFREKGAVGLHLPIAEESGLEPEHLTPVRDRRAENGIEQVGGGAPRCAVNEEGLEDYRIVVAGQALSTWLGLQREKPLENESCCSRRQRGRVARAPTEGRPR